MSQFSRVVIINKQTRLTRGNVLDTIRGFNFNTLEKEAIGKLKSGQALTGKDGVLTLLIKRILEAALEEEMESHLSDCKDQGQINHHPT